MEHPVFPPNGRAPDFDSGGVGSTPTKAALALSPRGRASDFDSDWVGSIPTRAAQGEFSGEGLFY